MRRSNLVAFAFGAFASLVSVGVASQFKADPIEAKAYRTVFAPDIIEPEGELDETSNIAFEVGEVLRECGLSEFDMKLGDLHGITYEIEISAKNMRGLHCIEVRARDVDNAVKLGFKVI